MCDTQVLLADNGIWFAKNSDREPNEPQALVQIAAVRGDRTRTVRTTYIDIPQIPDRHALILSKPTWIWGGEMGVNEHGVAIGNEAIFSRARSLKPALLGMDLLRLGLERASTAVAAIDVMTALLEQHGQGGPAGHADRSFHYDSSFIVADPTQAWVLETSGREWAARQAQRYAAISNALTLDTNYQRSSVDVSGSFRNRDTRLLPYFAASTSRRSLSLRCLQQTAAHPQPEFADLARHLRSHHAGRVDPLHGSNKDVCMHAAGPIRRSQTTGSMIAWLGPFGPRVVATGTSAPCLSLFRPISLHLPGHAYAEDSQRARLWHSWEPVHRAALFDTDYRHQLQSWRDQNERDVFAAWMQADPNALELDRLSAQASAHILDLARPNRPLASGGLRRYWRY